MEEQQLKLKIGDRNFFSWEDFKIGDTVECECKQSPGPKGNLWAKRNGLDWKFMGRRIGKDKFIVVRIR